MDLKDKNILVTGGTGFLGSYILRTLCARGYSNIKGIRRSTSKMGLVGAVQNLIEWHEADLDDYDILDSLLENVDIIIHAAAIVSFVPEEESEMMRINVQATGQLVDLALKHNIEKFIYVSSVAALGRSKVDKLIDENEVWVDSKLNSKYAISKQYGEREVWRGYAEGLPIAVINPSFIIGAGYWKEGPSSIFNKIYNGLSYYPTGTNGVVDVRDVAHMIEVMLATNITGQRYIACADNVPHKDLFTKIANSLNKKPPYRKVTPLLGALAAWVEKVKSKVTGHRPIVTRETMTTSNLSFKYSNSKSIDELSFIYKSVDSSIHEICQSYLSSLSSQSDFGTLDL